MSTELPHAADLAVEVIAGGLADPTGPALTADHAHAAAVREVVDLVAAFVDADVLHTDAELAAYLEVAGSLLGGPLAGASADDLRRSGRLVGARARLTRPSEVFTLAVVADARDGGGRAWAHLQAVVALVHAVAAVDLDTSTVELDALARYRHLLLATMHEAGVRTPEQRTPDGGFFSRRDSPASRSTPAVPDVLDMQDRPDVQDVPDVPGATLDPPRRPLEEVLAELDGLTGLDAVKAEVSLVTDLLTVQGLRARRGLPTLPVSRHLVFTGNPGTGKTTVARLVAEIYASLGLLARGHLVETHRSGLVAGYVGQTAERTAEVVASALDGVLLIDEAHALARGDDGRDFGREAIDTLVKLMEDHRDRLVVIVTGYPEEMGHLIGANPGLASRFPRTLHFPDYTGQELAAIAANLAARHGYHLAPEGAGALTDVLAAIPRGRGFGNGRLARNLVEAAITRHAARVARLGDGLAALHDDELSTLTAHDVRAAALDVAA